LLEFNNNPDVDPKTGRAFRAKKPQNVKTESKKVIVPENSNKDNDVLFETETEKFLMNDRQQKGFEAILSFILKNYKKGQTNRFDPTSTVSFKGGNKEFDNIIPEVLWNRMVGLIGR
ncbi:MAG: hypothetical protein ACK55I_19335, partial [bacterium]